MKKLIVAIALLMPGVAHAAFPVIEGTNTYATDTDATSHVIPLPTGVAEDDLLLIWWCSDHSSDEVTAPAGWKTSVYIPENSSAIVGVLLYKVAGASETNPTVTIANAESASAISFRVSGYSRFVPGGVSTPVAVVNSSSNGPSDLDVMAAEDIVWIGLTAWDSAVRSMSTYPANYTTNTVESRGTISNAVGVAAAWRNLNASSEDIGDFVISGADQRISMAIAILPPATGGGGGSASKIYSQVRP